MIKLRVLSSILILFCNFAKCQSTDPLLEERYLKNYEAFTKLYGYIRFFHPSDEAQSIDWEKFAVYGMQKAENSESTEQLRNNLLELFLPIAPSIEIYPQAQTNHYDQTKFTPHDTSGLRKVYWQHYGVFLGNLKNIYKSTRINTTVQAGVSDFGTIRQILPANDLKGKKIKIKAFVKADVTGIGNSGHLWLRVDLPDKKKGFFDNMDSRPIKLNSWTEYEIKGDVSQDAERIVFGCFLQGAGEVWVDEFRFFVEENGDWKEIEINDPDFEKNNPGDKQLEWGSSYDEYSIEISEKEKYKGSKSLSISRGSENKTQEKIFEIEPGPSEVLSKDISSEFSCSFPVILFRDEKGTLPHSYTAKINELISKISKSQEGVPDANNKFVRLADICIAWNIFQHFYPYFDIVKTDWNAMLPMYLKKAAEDIDEFDFHKVLLEFISELKDGHGRVSFSKNKRRNYPPVVLDIANNKIVIAKVLDSNISDIEAGDEILEIDGTSIVKKMEQESKYISYATPQWKLRRLINEELIKENDGTEIVLTISKVDNSTKKIKLSRNLNIENIVKMDYYPEKRPKDIEEIKTEIFYVNLDKTSMGLLDSNINKLANAKGVIFDLRGYPNGNHDILSHLTDKPIRSAFFSTPRVIYPDRENWMPIDTASRWLMEPKLPRINGKVVFLVNGNAISYAESVMGIVEAYKLGTIIGEPTAGTNGNVNPFTLPGGFYITWTGMNVVKHDGSRHHGVGIIPDILVNRTIKGIREKRDEYLEKALEIIEGK